MRNYLSTLAFCAMLAPAAAMAQGAQPSPMDRLAEQLGLSDQQQSDIEAIIEEQRQKQMAIQQDTQKRINEVLTADQRAQLEEMQRQREEQMRRRMEEMQRQQQEQGAPPAQ